ncbi:HAD family hydrolase, partial [Streptomyces goshikiensis]
GPHSPPPPPPAGGAGAPPPPHPQLAPWRPWVDPPAAAVYVGDMAVDQEAAARAGVAYVHAGWGYGQPTSPAPEVVAPEGLLQLLRSDKSFVAGSLV